MNELISIIVPIYNTAKYLRRCVDSIIAQTYKNIEIILVDDGSTDDSGKICDDYLLRDHRINVIHKENGGLSDARNVGIDASKGEYLLFVDSDDIIKPQMCNNMIRSMNSSGADIVVCGFDYIYENGDSVEDFKSEIKDEILDKKAILVKLGGYGICYWHYVIACNKLYKRKLFKNIRFPIGKYHEDEFVAHKIYNSCKKICCIKDQLYIYVNRKNSIANSKTVKKLDGVEAILERAKFYDNKKLRRCTIEAIRLGLFVMNECYLFLNHSGDEWQRFIDIHNLYRKVYRSVNLSKASLPEKVYLKLALDPNFFFGVVKRLLRLKNKLKRR